MENIENNEDKKEERIIHQNPKSDEVDVTNALKKIKGLFNKDNPSASIFLFLALVSVIFSLIKVFEINIGSHIISRFINMFPPWILLFLTGMLFLSYVSARFHRYKLMFLPIVLWLLIITTFVRTTNIPQLKDVTTGDWTLGPDLDPFLYLRHALEINDGRLENPDFMRYAPIGVENYALKNLMPWAIIIVFKAINIFSENSLVYAAIVTPVILFLISTLGFLLFTKTVFSFKFSEKKAWAGAIIASLLYLASPSMLHRTVAGIPEIESLGMVFFWFAFLFFTLAWKNKSPIKITIYGVLSGIFTGAMSWTWGGYRYIYMILCLTTLLIFLFQKEPKKNFKIFLMWIIPAFALELLRVESVTSIMTNIADTGFGFFTLFILVVDWVLSKPSVEKWTKLDKINIYKPIKNGFVGLIFIFLVFSLVKGNFVFDIVSNIFERLLYPFGRGRVGLTVAENKVPYLTEILQNFDYLFWVFVIGTIMVFYTSLRDFNIKNKIWLNFVFLLMLAGLVFNRYSPTSLLNGENLISKTFYIGSLIVFALSVIYLLVKAYAKKDEKTLNEFKEIDFSYIILVVFSFWALVSMRGAIRLLIIIAAILPIFSGFLLIKIFDYKNKVREIKKVSAIISIIIVLILLFTVFVHYYEATSASAKSTIPSSYNQQWQKAMSWVRENTPEKSIFVHWWDYGYWVQTLGERPTVTDGGHPISYWDHLIGRYVLTTPYPETALSFMKTHNVSYLLIDSTDLGKYSAYSSIGDDAESNDRSSWIPIMGLDAKQTRETANSTINVYVGGTTLDKDVIYEQNGNEIFLPEGMAGLGGVILEIEKNGTQQKVSQPTGVFVYNGQQFSLPIRKLYLNGELLDFGQGVKSTIIVIPAAEISQTGGVNINNIGAIIYLSEKTQDSLFSKLYLMNDPLDEYETIKPVYSEHDLFVGSLKSQGANIGDFIYYQGFRGPIKIWEVKYPENTLENEEFLRVNGGYGEFDELVFKK